jgi:Tol biopolymer transport system component
MESPGGDVGDNDLWVAAADGTGRRKLTSGGDVRRPVWSRDGRTLVYAAWNRLWKVDVRGGEPAVVASAPESTVPTDTLDADEIAVTHGGAVGALDMISGRLRPLPLPAGASAARWSRDGKRVAFLRGTDVFVAAADGSGVRRLTDGLGVGDRPCWSADGRTLVVSSDPGEWRLVNLPLAVMNAPPTSVGNPSWSPDGTSIAYTGNRYGEPGIYLMNADGTSPRRVPIAGLQPRWPSWSPDGSLLAFAAVPPGEKDALDLFVARPDGTGVRQVTRGGWYGGLAGWSRDGAHLAFYSRKEGRWDVYTVAIDGTALTRITDGAGEHHVASWTREGALLMTANRDGTEDIWIVDPATRRFTKVLHAPEGADVARMSPRGDWISFSTRVDGRWQLHLARPDGSGRRRITDAESYATTSTWSPDGRRLAYECKDGVVRHICVIGADGGGRRVITPLP